MECKRCGHALPPTGFICPNCKMMLSGEQIKIQKERLQMSKPLNTGMVSEKYGHKDFIYKKREKKKPKFIGIVFLLGILLLLAFIGIFV